jgi:hypothetical protein
MSALRVEIQESRIASVNSKVSGFPLVFDLQMIGGQAEMGMIKPGPFGTFSYASRLAGADDRFVSINKDTIYSIAEVDVSSGPVLLRVPDTAGRYYVLQFVDAWTNNFAYVGRRPPAPRPGPSSSPRRDGKMMRPTCLLMVMAGPADLAASLGV